MSSPIPPENQETIEPAVAAPDPAGPLRGWLTSVRARIIGGLVVALPIVLTFWIVFWLYTTLTQGLLDPLADFIGSLVKAPWAQQLWWKRFVSPLLAIVLLLSFLYFLGGVGQTWVTRLIDGVLLRVPLVTTIYKAIRNVAQSLASQFQQQHTQRVVLVKFPHPGSRALAFVTNTLQDKTTGKKIHAVCVLTGVFPPAGFTLFVPEEELIDLDWTLNQSLQAIISGGMTAPETVPFFPAPRDHLAATNQRPDRLEGNTSGQP